MFWTRRVSADACEAPYRAGVVRRRDVALVAERLYRRISEPPAQNARTAGERAFARHDYARAAQLLLPEAELGDPVAQTYIGYMYQNGLGVPRDYVVAASWLNRAAQQGEPTAQFLLGLLFDKGFGVPQDWVQAEVWLNLAASRAGERRARLLAACSRRRRTETNSEPARGSSTAGV